MSKIFLTLSEWAFSKSLEAQKLQKDNCVFYPKFCERSTVLTTEENYGPDFHL